MATIRPAASRLLASTIGRQCRTYALQAPRKTFLQPQSIRSQQPRMLPSLTPIRHHSAPSPGPTKVYNFEQVQDISTSPQPSQILIDVREPHEYAAGYIPTAINLPIKSQPDALFLPAEEFEDRFGFAKPQQDSEVVFYCKSGVRSSAAANLASQVGYARVGEYRGSWLDWVKMGGEEKK